MPTLTRPPTHREISGLFRAIAGDPCAGAPLPFCTTEGQHLTRAVTTA
jgi:hypothetical protein